MCAWRRQRFQVGSFKETQEENLKNKESIAGHDKPFPDLPNTIFKHFTDDDEETVNRVYSINQKFRRQFKEMSKLFLYDPKNPINSRWLADVDHLIPKELTRKSSKRSKTTKLVSENGFNNINSTNGNPEKQHSEHNDEEGEHVSNSESDSEESNKIPDSEESEGEEAIDYLTNYFDSGEKYLSDDDQNDEGVM
ncbi:hypothetical protein GJ496_002838 [Pomphorhynchus laevis]|nr:hypothetical protein GJ496_002838 [Pomphorhynchus laevis]